MSEFNRYHVVVRSPEEFRAVEALLLEAGYFWWKDQKSVTYDGKRSFEGGVKEIFEIHENPVYIETDSDGELFYGETTYDDGTFNYSTSGLFDGSELLTFNWQSKNGTIEDGYGNVIFGKPYVYGDEDKVKVSEKAKLDGIKIKTTFGNFFKVYDYLGNIGYDISGPRPMFSPTLNNNAVAMFAYPDGAISWDASADDFDAHPFQEYELTFTVSMVPKENKPELIELNGTLYRKEALEQILKNLTGVSTKVGV